MLKQPLKHGITVVKIINDTNKMHRLSKYDILSIYRLSEFPLSNNYPPPVKLDLESNWAREWRDRRLLLLKILEQKKKTT